MRKKHPPLPGNIEVRLREMGVKQTSILKWRQERRLPAKWHLRLMNMPEEFPAVSKSNANPHAPSPSQETIEAAE